MRSMSCFLVTLLCGWYLLCSVCYWFWFISLSFRLFVKDIRIIGIVEVIIFDYSINNELVWSEKVL